MRETQEAFERLLQAAEAGEALPRPLRPDATSGPEQEATELLALAERLHRLQYIQVAPDARKRILARALNTPAQPQQRGRILQFPARRTEWTRTASRIAASAAAVAILGFGTVSASAASLPDSPFYSVKLLVEDVRVAVAQPEQKSRLYTEQATQRLRETQAMIESNNIPAAERSADVAARRLAEAISTVDSNQQPDVATAIDTATNRAKAVNDEIVQRGGTAPKTVVAALVTAVPQSSAPATSNRAALAAPSPTTPTPAPTAEPTPAPTETTPDGAPARGFTPIAGEAPAATNGPTAIPPSAVPTQAQVAAPAATAFIQILVGSSPTVGTPGPTVQATPGAPGATYVPIETAASPTRGIPSLVPVISPTATNTALPTLAPATSTSAPTRTPEPTATAVPHTATATPANQLSPIPR